MDFDSRDYDDPRDPGDESRDLGRGGALDARDRAASDPRDVFMRDLSLPRGDERERVHDRGREYALRESESRTLTETTPDVACVPSDSLRALRSLR